LSKEIVVGKPSRELGTKGLPKLAALFDEPFDVIV
jgi:hypothetical protein